MATLDFLVNQGTYESAINRKGWGFRSARLDAVVKAVDAYILRPSSANLDTVEQALAKWERTDPKEFKDRGLPVKDKMAGEIQLARLQALSDQGKVAIPILDPNDHPKYEPQLWNRWPQIESTNCYAYACDSREGHLYKEKPQPGSYEATGLGPVSNDTLSFESAKANRTAAAVRLAIMRDGQAQGINQRLIPIIRRPGEPVSNISGHYLIALVIASGYQIPQYANEIYIRDYHWYRQDRDGTWSHKPGHSSATNLDGSGNRIYDPRVCDMHADFWESEGGNDYFCHVHYEFVMFFYSPRGGVKVGMQPRMVNAQQPWMRQPLPAIQGRGRSGTL